MLHRTTMMLVIRCGLCLAIGIYTRFMVHYSFSVMTYSNNDNNRAFVYPNNNTADVTLLLMNNNHNIVTNTSSSHAIEPLNEEEEEKVEEMVAAVTISNNYRTFIENFNDSNAAAVVDDNTTDDMPTSLINNHNNSFIVDHPMLSNTTTTNIEEEPINPHVHIWINVKTFAEGIGGWSTTLVELIRLANTTITNRSSISIVEPCMLHGRLGMCGDDNNNNSSSRSIPIPISEIFDMKEVLGVVQPGRLFPIMVPYHEYSMHTSTNSMLQYNICMSRLRGNNINPIPVTRCPTSTLLPKDVDLSKLLSLQRQASSSSDGNSSSSSSSISIILNLEDCWMNDSKLGQLIGIDKHITSNKVLLPQLSFHPNHINTVDRILTRVNITGNNTFSVIHWRAEKNNMDYIDCANAVLHAKIRMLEEEEEGDGSDVVDEGQQQEQKHHSFILLTSLNYNASKMWTGSRNAVNKVDTVKQALDMLLIDNQFIAFDNLLSQEMEDSSSSSSREEETDGYHHQGGVVQQRQQYYYHDSGMLAIYDLILAIKSKTFASCARDESYGCDDVATAVCDRCNHIGKFGKLAISLRRKFNPITSNSTSWGCWPQPKKMA